MANITIKDGTSLSHYLGAAVLVAILLVGAWGWYQLKSYDKALVKAANVEQQFDAFKTTSAAQIAVNKSLQEQLAQTQKVIVQVVHVRDSTAQDKQAAIAAQTPAQVAVNALSALNVKLANPGEPNKVCFSPDAVKQFEATKVDRDRLLGDLADETSLYTQATKSTALAESDFTAQTETLTEAEAALKAYKSAAKKSRISRILDTAEKVSLVVVTFYVTAKVVGR